MEDPTLSVGCPLQVSQELLPARFQAGLGSEASLFRGCSWPCQVPGKGLQRGFVLTEALKRWERGTGEKADVFSLLA